MALGTLGTAIAGSVISAGANKLLGGSGSQSGGGGSNQMTQKTVVTMPKYLDKPVQDTLLGAYAESQKPFVPFSVADRISQFTPDQLNAFNTLRGQMGQYQPYMNQAFDLNQLAGQLATSGYLTPERIREFTSPYQQGVTDIAKREALKRFDIQMNDIGDFADRAGAFGGDRHAILESESYKDIARQLSDLQATGDQNAYSAAVQAALQSGTSQAQGLSGAASLFSNLAGAAQGYNLNDINALLGIGGQQQALSQAEKDFGYQQFTEQKEHPYTQASKFMNLAMPLFGGTTSQSGMNQQYTPGLGTGQAALGGASLAAGLFPNGFGGSSFTPSNMFSGSTANAPGLGSVMNGFSAIGAGGGGFSWPFKEGGLIKYAGGGRVREDMARREEVFDISQYAPEDQRAARQMINAIQIPYTNQRYGETRNTEAILRLMMNNRTPAATPATPTAPSTPDTPSRHVGILAPELPTQAAPAAQIATDGLGALAPATPVVPATAPTAPTAPVALTEPLAAAPVATTGLAAQAPLAMPLEPTEPTLGTLAPQPLPAPAPTTGLVNPLDPVTQTTVAAPLAAPTTATSPTQGGTNYLGLPAFAAGGKVQKYSAGSLVVDEKYQRFLANLEKKHGLPKGLLAHTAKVESSNDLTAISKKKALGPFQITPIAAEDIGVRYRDMTDPYKAAEASAKIHAKNLKRFGGDKRKALAAYNWGPSAVAEHGLASMPKETRDYLQKFQDFLVPMPNQADLSPPLPPKKPVDQQDTDFTRMLQMLTEKQANIPLQPEPQDTRIDARTGSPSDLDMLFARFGAKGYADGGSVEPSAFQNLLGRTGNAVVSPIQGAAQRMLDTQRGVAENLGQGFDFFTKPETQYLAGNARLNLERGVYPEKLQRMMQSVGETARAEQLPPEEAVVEELLTSMGVSESPEEVVEQPQVDMSRLFSAPPSEPQKSPIDTALLAMGAKILSSPGMPALSALGLGVNEYIGVKTAEAKAATDAKQQLFENEMLSAQKDINRIQAEQMQANTQMAQELQPLKKQELEAEIALNTAKAQNDPLLKLAIESLSSNMQYLMADPNTQSQILLNAYNALKSVGGQTGETTGAIRRFNPATGKIE